MRGAITSLAAAACLALGSPALPGAEGAQVHISHFMFTPPSVTLRAGSTLRWINDDEEPHTVVSVDGLFRSAAVDGGESFEFRFEKPGTYRYICTVHPQMSGEVIVQ
ncbi:MAG: cupredoxin family copper-binding protein [Gammaproteobacteria bacterium]|nr:cupredoxin family copper-binding protein [Gammaproteobacteria bacterium]MBV9696480.1 cupredoxin family copper-binding protein [Gammaproteobacteria bacterium]